MWIPKNEEELVAVVTSGDLTEGPTFEAKREIGHKNNKEIAKDICAMTIDGGVIIYGIAEDDEHKRLTQLAPFELKGQAERLNMIARSAISEAPRIETKEIATAANPAEGYIVLVVPQSDRAPHMVTADNDNRYYRRNDKESVRCSQGEVDRLYERRRRWEVDRGVLLDEAIINAPHGQVDGQSFLHAFVKPLSSNSDLLARMTREGESEQAALRRVLKDASDWSRYPVAFSPTFSEPHRITTTVAGYRTWMAGAPTEKPASLLTVDVADDLSCALFCGRLSEVSQDGGRIFFADILAGCVLRFLWFAGDALAQAGYWGSVEAGIAVTELKGVYIHSGKLNWIARHQLEDLSYPQQQYRRTARFTVSQMKDEPVQAATALVMPLIRAMSQRHYDPFSVFK